MKDRRTPTLWPIAPALLLLLAFSGCTARKPVAYRTFLLPPASPLSDSTLAAAAPPPVEPPYLIHETPDFLDDRKLPEPSTAEPLIRRAEARYQEGRRLFRLGQMESAREQFDRAIDILLSGRITGASRLELEKKVGELADAIHQYDLSGLTPAQPDSEPGFEQPPLEELPELTFPIDPKLRDQVAEQLKTTVSQLPLEINDDVLRYINYFTSTRGRKIYIYGATRAGRYRTMIRRILDEEGVPQELIHLAQAESGFAPRAVSRARATGMWQFMLFRGQQYGLTRTKEKDDRLDPELATRAAAKHLKDLYTEFGDWYLTMAAYNCGPVCVEKAVERTGYADVWELRRRSVLPRETSNYVPIVLAMAIIGKNPAQYGIDQIDPEPPLEYSTIELDAPAHLALIADITDRPVADLRDLNPSLLTTIVPAGHPLHVPPGSGQAILTALQLIPAPRRTAWRLRRVTEDDSLASIARFYKTTPQQIASANPSGNELPEVGSFLVVPAPEQVRRPATSSAARRPAAAKPAAAKPAAGAPATAQKQPAGKALAPATAQKQPAGKAPAPATAQKKPAGKAPSSTAAKGHPQASPPKPAATAVASAKRSSSSVSR